MYQSNAASIYKQNQINTASPKQLIILLYQGAIKNIRHAELAVEKNDLSLKNEKLIKAQNIIQELQSSLDFAQGADIAKELDALYTFMLGELIQANVNKDIEKMTNVRTLLNDLLTSWNAI